MAPRPPFCRDAALSFGALLNPARSGLNPICSSGASSPICSLRQNVHSPQTTEATAASACSSRHRMGPSVRSRPAGVPQSSTCTNIPAAHMPTVRAVVNIRRTRHNCRTWLSPLHYLMKMPTRCVKKRQKLPRSDPFSLFLRLLKAAPGSRPDSRRPPDGPRLPPYCIAVRLAPAERRASCFSESASLSFAQKSCAVSRVI